MILLTHLLLSVSSETNGNMWGILGVLLGVIPLYRHDGLAIALPMILTLPIFFWSQRKKVAWLCSWRYVFFYRVKRDYIPY